MRMDDFEGQYAHGFSIALDSVLCRVGVNESSAVGFSIVSDTLLFYRMVQAHFRQLRFWAWYGSTSGDASFEFREGETGKSPALPKQTDQAVLALFVIRPTAPGPIFRMHSQE